MRRALVVGLRVAVVAIACGGGGGDDGDTSTGDGGDDGTGDAVPCVGTTMPPAPPSILTPEGGDVFPDDIVITTSDFVDVDGDQHVATELEIWLVSGGELVSRAWSARLTDPLRLTTATLADGIYDFGAQLGDRTNYALRARYQDSGSECASSDWGSLREFAVDESSYLFDPDAIHTFELEIPQESWGPINSEAETNGCEQTTRNYYRGTLRFQGQVFDGVGIRAKGGCGSSRDLSGKTAFKINLEWDDPSVPGCPADRRLYGLDTITLNNSVQDRTAMHERMAYRYFEAAGVVAPRAANARVMVNGELFGLYVHVETISRRFLRRRLENPEGMMYEGAYWCDLIEENVPDTLDGDTCFQREFKPDACDGTPQANEDVQDWELLRELTQRLAAMPAGQFAMAVPEIIEWDAFLTMMAVEGVMAHWDGYPWELNNNYRVYHDPITDRWRVLPWGVDQTFDRDFDPWEEATGVLARACLDDPACEAAYAQRLHEMTNLYEQLDFMSQVTAMEPQLRPHVEEDPRKEYGIDQWQNNVNGLERWAAERAQRVRDILAAHGY